MGAPNELLVCVLSRKMNAVIANAQGNLVEILKVGAYSSKGVGSLGIFVIAPIGAEETLDSGEGRLLEYLLQGRKGALH
jgi:hypothetical protein